MIKIEFSAEEIAQLRHERYHHPHPRVQQKMEVLLLKSEGLPHQDIARIAGICENTLRSYLKDYQEHGIEKLKEINFYRPSSSLSAYRGTLEDYFKEHPVATLASAMSKIEEITGIKRSPGRVSHFLKSLGMKRRKVGMVPAKADPEIQEEFKKKELEPRLEEARKGERVVFFVDAAHFVLAPFLGFLWSMARYFIKAPCGRQRFNVLGALNAFTHDLIMVTNDTTLNAESVGELLRRIASLGLIVPVTLIMDNAKYQKCKIVRELAEALKIELLYLPTYSPNLNLIERVWKYVKNQCLYSKYHKDFDEFKSVIMNCLEQTTTTHKKPLDSLLSLNFQSFSKAQFITA